MAVSNAVATLLEEYKRFNSVQMKDLFAADDKRAEKYTLSLGELTFDYSKNRFNYYRCKLLANLTFGKMRKHYKDKKKKLKAKIKAVKQFLKEK